MLDLSHIPAVDGHAHLFDLEPLERDPADVLTLSLHHPPREQRTATLWYRRTMRLLARELGVSDPARAWAARQAAAGADYAAYVRRLFTGARIEALLIDVGYQPASVGLAEFRTFAPCRVEYMYRLETVVDELWRERPGLAAAEARLESALSWARSELKVVAYKTIIGYRTGLAVDPAVSRDQAAAALRDGAEKPFRDWCLLTMLARARDYGLPVQVHTGFGESNICMERNNPLLLKPFLESGRCEGVNLVLLHGSHPYGFELGYTVAAYPNVYCEFSELIPFAQAGARRTLLDLLSMAPLNKVMYGSDGYILPEVHWSGAIAGREELGWVLGHLVERDFLDRDEAPSVAADILGGTARRLYGL